MIKKVLVLLILFSSVLFFSCGSTKQESEIQQELEPAAVSEAVEQTEAADSVEQTAEETETSEQTSSLQEQTSSSQESSIAEEINEMYPPLEEIEEPDLIDISPQELAEQLVLAEKETEQEENKISEPVEETEELPPLPDAEETPAVPAVPEALEGLEGLEEQEGLEGQEETPVEPVIEIMPEDAVPEVVIVPSRSVSLNKGETLVITYPGNGWIYMGSTSEYNNLANRGRKLGTTDTTYTLLAKEAGTQIHHFYKTDNLTGEYIDDFIEVTVIDKKGKSSTVVNAPDYKEVVPKKPETPAKSSTTKKAEKEAEEAKAQAAAVEEASAQKTEPAKTTAPAPVTVPAAEEDDVIEIDSDESVIVIEEEEEALDLAPLLESARKAVSSKKYDDAYPALTQYLEFSTDNRDEALYLLGQLLESDSKYKNIKQAIETYETLCDSYPASKYWDQANKRIVYLKRFYINIH